MVRNVGKMMKKKEIMEEEGNEVKEGIMDEELKRMIEMNDIGKNGRKMNQREGQVYIVKKKMNGKEEVELENEILKRKEEMIGMKKNKIKIGIMEEERRKKVNIKEEIREEKDRVVLINKGLIERKGEEIKK